MRSGMLVSLNQRAVRLRLCRLTTALLWLAGAVSETSAAPSLRPCALLQRPGVDDTKARSMLAEFLRTPLAEVPAPVLDRRFHGERWLNYYFKKGRLIARVDAMSGAVMQVLFPGTGQPRPSRPADDAAIAREQQLCLSAAQDFVAKHYPDFETSGLASEKASAFHIAGDWFFSWRAHDGSGIPTGPSVFVEVSPVPPEIRLYKAAVRTYKTKPRISKGRALSAAAHVLTLDGVDPECRFICDVDDVGEERWCVRVLIPPTEETKRELGPDAELAAYVSVDGEDGALVECVGDPPWVKPDAQAQVVRREHSDTRTCLDGEWLSLHRLPLARAGDCLVTLSLFRALSGSVLSRQPLVLEGERGRVELQLGSQTVFVEGQPRQAGTAPERLGDEPWIPASVLPWLVPVKAKWHPERKALALRTEDYTGPDLPEKPKLDLTPPPPEDEEPLILGPEPRGLVADDCAPSISADGTTVAFLTARRSKLSPPREPGQWRYGLAIWRNGEIRIVEGLPGHLIEFPMISPSGRRVAYYCLGEVYVVDLQTGIVARQTTKDRPAFSPAWSPDEKYLAVRTGYSRPPGLYLLDLTCSLSSIHGQIPVCRMSGVETPAFNSEGSYIAFRHDPRAPLGAPWASEVWLAGVPGGPAADVEPHCLAVGFRKASRPTWLPGDKTLFVRDIEDGDKMYYIDVETGEKQLVGPPVLYDPTFPQAPLRWIDTPHLALKTRRWVFAMYRWSGKEEDEGGRYLYSAMLDWSDVRRLTPLDNQTVPAWVFPDTGKTTPTVKP